MPTNRTLAALAITVREQPRMNPTSRQNDGALPLRLPECRNPIVSGVGAWWQHALESVQPNVELRS